jgi:probable HAF family extracellular repeat protein
MNGSCKYVAVGCLFLFIASAGFAQMYKVTDITPPGTASEAYSINNAGQVVGYDSNFGGFRTAPNRPMNPATDLLGVGVRGLDINDSGQVAGYIWSGSYSSAFTTAPNSLVQVPLGGPGTYGHAINASGQVVVDLYSPGGSHSFRTAPNAPVNPATDDLGALPPEGYTGASGLNNAGQVVGASGRPRHAFRTAPNKPINPATDDLGTLGGPSSAAFGINAFGQVVGVSDIAGDDTVTHAFRTAPNRPINPATDDLGPGGANAINDYGEVVGTDRGPCDPSMSCDSWSGSPFLYSSGTRHDLNKLIPSGGTNCGLAFAEDINNVGQILAWCEPMFDDQGAVSYHSVLLTPVYKAFVRPPIKPDGSSVFPAKRRVLPVKFTLTINQAPTCALLPATIAITKAAGGTLVVVGNNMYLRSNLGSRFRIDPTACQYIYDLPTSGLGVGVYRVDISINQIFVGHAVFTLKLKNVSEQTLGNE